MSDLSGKQRRWLRGQAHSLKPVVQLGARGLTDAVVAEVDAALEVHELIKVRLAGDRDERQAVAADLADRVEAAAVGLTGTSPCSSGRTTTRRSGASALPADRAAERRDLDTAGGRAAAPGRPDGGGGSAPSAPVLQSLRRMLLSELVATSERIGATRSRREKADLLAALLRRLGPAEVGIGVAYLAGELPQGRIGVGPALLGDAVPGEAAAEAALSLAEVDATLSRCRRRLGGRRQPAAQASCWATLLGARHGRPSSASSPPCCSASCARGRSRA